MAIRCRRSTPPRPRANEGSPTRPTRASRWRRGPGAYLHANCGHCHSDHGGGSVPLRLQFPAPVAEMKAVGVRPTRGDFALPDACIIKPGDPCASTLYFRMAKFGRDRMPHIGSERPDEAGLKLIAQWIAGMKRGRGTDGPSPGQRTAWPVAGQPEVGAAAGAEARTRRAGTAERDALLAAAAKLPAGPIRDLFEGYLPRTSGRSGSSARTPGPGPSWLSSGDPGRGEKLFWSQPVQCGSCHKIGDRGTPVGPDLIDHRQASLA